MRRLDWITGRLARLLIVATLIGVPAAVFGYDRVLDARVPPGAKVFSIYFNGKMNWTGTRISGLNMWSDPPDLKELAVRKGDLVILRLMATDVHHGFTLPEFGVDPIEIAPGEYHEVRFVADHTGRFPMFCTIVCGPAHKKMQAWLVVSE